MKEPMDPTPEFEPVRSIISSVQAPHSLREHIAAAEERTLVRRMVVRRMKLTGVLAGCAAVLGATFALIAPSHSGAPTSLEAATLGTRPVAASAPLVDSAHPHLLTVSEGGIPFPRWAERYPWKASGQRSDELGGRETRTVFYDSPEGVRLGYTIVDGKPLDWPGGANVVTSHGVPVHVLHRDGRVIAVWRAHGHTCVISAPDSVPDDRMVALASDHYVS